MQPRLPTCENTLKWASEQAIPSLEHSFHYLTFLGLSRGRRGASPLRRLQINVTIGDVEAWRSRLREHEGFLPQEGCQSKRALSPRSFACRGRS